MGKFKSKESAIDAVKRMFASNPIDDTVSIEQIFSTWGRPQDVKHEINKGWLSNKLTALKHHNLVVPLYKFEDGRKKLDKIQLTTEGKRALGRIINSHEHEDISKRPNVVFSIGDVMAIVAKLKKDNPEYEINFDVRLKVESN